MPGFTALSPELLEEVLRATLDGPARLDSRNLASFSLVNSEWASAARRISLRWVTVDSPDVGARLLTTLRNPTCGSCVRSLVIKAKAFDEPSVFSDLSASDLVRLASNLVEIDSPRALFAPLGDGRKPLAGYPSTLVSVRLGLNIPLSPPSPYDSEDDSDDESLATPQAATISAQHVTLVREFPRTLTTLKLVDLPRSVLPEVPPDVPLDFPLKALHLDSTRVSPATFKWLLSTARDLETLEVWLVDGVLEADLLEVAQQKGRGLKEFLFKPAGNQGERLANELVLYMPTLKKVALGDKACDHKIWANMPAGLTHICIALPGAHRNARLPTVALALATRLTNVRRLEIYSGLYFPPTVEVEYPLPDPYNLQDQGLRELRLSHVWSSDLEAFVRDVGRGLYTLALHHVSIACDTLLPYCPRLRRLELGAANVVSSESKLCDYLHPEFLTFARLHFASYVNLDYLVSSIALIRDRQRATGGHHRLATLELVGNFPSDLVAEGWHSGARIDALVAACKREGVSLCINGRPVATIGDMWGALLGQTGREALL